MVTVTVAVMVTVTVTVTVTLTVTVRERVRFTVRVGRITSYDHPQRHSGLLGAEPRPQ